jgi:hypothetical protein
VAAGAKTGERRLQHGWHLLQRLTNADRALAALADAGYRLSPRLRAEILGLAGENSGPTD